MKVEFWDSGGEMTAEKKLISGRDDGNKREPNKKLAERGKHSPESSQGAVKEPSYRVSCLLKGVF